MEREHLDEEAELQEVSGFLFKFLLPHMEAHSPSQFLSQTSEFQINVHAKFP